jgi:hypothetical protein
MDTTMRRFLREGQLEYSSFFILGRGPEFSWVTGKLTDWKIVRIQSPSNSPFEKR